MTPVVPTQDDEDRWYQYTLAEAGFHPGPVDGNIAREDTERALREMQRSFPRPDGTTFVRLNPTGTKDPDTTAILAMIGADTLPWFGDPSNRTDLTRPDAEARLRDPQHPSGVIAWIGHRHYYTGKHPGLAYLPVEMFLNDYHGKMELGDRLVKRDAEVLSRPWLPLGVDIPLLRRDAGDGLAAGNRIVHDGTRGALGPLHVAWQVFEVGEDLSVIPLTHAAYDRTRIRSHKFVEHTVEKNQVTRKGRTYANCPTSQGGIRPESINEYGKTAFGHGEDSLAPWQATDAGRHGVVTLVHDEMGQDAAHFHAVCQGRTGVYFRPSLVAGDGYRVRASVYLGGGAGKHPNRKVLQRRYPVTPHAHTCSIRMWRKTSFRGHTAWSPGAHHWPACANDTIDLYSQAFVHIVYEDVPANLQVPLSTLIDQTEYEEVIRSRVTHRDYASLPITLELDYVWPYINEKHYGIQPSDPGETLQEYRDGVIEKCIAATWTRFRRPMLWFLLSKIERDFGRMKGHFVVEFRSSPRVNISSYRCNVCGVEQHEVTNRCAPGDLLAGKPCRRDGCGGGFRWCYQVSLYQGSPSTRWGWRLGQLGSSVRVIRRTGRTRSGINGISNMREHGPATPPSHPEGRSASTTLAQTRSCPNRTWVVAC